MCKKCNVYFIRIIVSTIFFIAATLFFSQNVSANLKVNEFACFTADDWVEILNAGDENVDLTLYQLTDSTQSNIKDLEGMIGPGAFVVVEWNKLNKDADSVNIRFKESGTVVDSIEYGDGRSVSAPISENQTIGRSPDGSETILVFSEGSKGSTNNSQIIFYSPTPTPTVTLTPTKIPTPTKSPTPTKTPKPTPTKPGEVLSAVIRNVTSKPVETTDFKKSDETSSIGAVPTASLGSNSHPTEPNAEHAIEVASENKNMKGKASLVASGIIFMTVCGILFYRSYRR